MKIEHPLCPYRVIGRVQIVDLIPRLTGPDGEAWLEVMEKHFFHGQQRAVVVNLSKVTELDAAQLRRLMFYMERPLKRAFFSHDKHAKDLVPDYVNPRMPLLSQEEEVVDYFGLDLIERYRDAVPRKERRKFHRFKVVMPTEILVKGKNPFSTKAIITNISEGGAFAQYLDLEASMQMAGLEDSPRLPVEMVLKHPGTSECELVKGSLVRVELLGQQRGVAIHFKTPLSDDSLLVKRFQAEGNKNESIQEAPESGIDPSEGRD